VGLANLGSESETCVGSLVHLVGVPISFEKNFYRLPFTPPLSGSSYRSFNGVPSRIVSDRGIQFTSRFWKSLHKVMGTKLDFSSAYHPQTDGYTERANQILEDMLRACVLTYGKDWEQSLPYAEFSYNNGYQASLGMSPFEALYGRKCRTPLMSSEVGEHALVGPALIKEVEE
jgi:hypothetical protein